MLNDYKDQSWKIFKYQNHFLKDMEYNKVLAWFDNVAVIVQFPL